MIEPRKPQRSAPKPIFQTAWEARIALRSDRLGTVYHRLHEVYVVTAHGSGTFSREDW